MLYISHRITGTATADTKKHCEQAINFTNALRHYFPLTEFYVPAESEPFVARVHAKKWMTVQQILDIDCEIIREDCNGVIFFVTEGDFSSGMREEYNCCRAHNIPFMILNGHVSENLPVISSFLNELREDS